MKQNKNYEISIVIPSYNESENIIEILDKIEKLFLENSNLKNILEIIIVNNGSNDDTDKIIKSNFLFKSKIIAYLLLQQNRGYGNGIIQGINISKGQIISWTHADNQTDFKDVIKIFNKYKKKLNENEILVKGKRKNRNFFDAFFTFGMSLFVFLITRKFLADINAQPKVFNRKLYNKFANPPHDFSLDLYTLMLAKKNNINIIEFPVYFKKRKFGIAKGGGTIKGKMTLIFRTIKYIIKIKKYGNNSPQNK